MDSLKHILDSISDLELDRKVFSEDEEAEECLTRVFDALGRLWPLEDSAYNPRIVIKSKANEKQGLHQALQGVLRNPETMYRYDHDARLEIRGSARVELEGWEKLHRARFTQLALEFIASFCLPNTYRNLPVNILVVDNKPNEIGDYDEFLPPELGPFFWENRQVWKVGEMGDGFEKWKKYLQNLRSHGSGGSLQEDFSSCRWDNFGLAGEATDEGVRLDQIDLVLQDQFLGASGKNPLGTELSELYFDVMPQALVFLTTGLGLESISAYGGTRTVDRVLSKTHLAALPWYYYIVFTRTLGAMFWEPWLRADEEKDPLGSRESLRHLLGAIRRWQREPEILWHGQGLPEMVDHAHRHISDLWRFANEIVGARRDALAPAVELPTGRSLKGINAAERVLLALAIWLHDVGHRGDRFVTDPAAVRDVHGSISERLLLRDPSAFGLEWLSKLGGDQVSEAQNWTARNCLDAPLTPLRLVGLLCRHHQSSAPLTSGDVQTLHSRFKFPSDYARVAYGWNGELLTDGDVLELWTDSDADLPWAVTDVRTLEDFSAQHEQKATDDNGKAAPGWSANLLKCGCLLRFLDALHLHRCRAGSVARRRTHAHFLRERIEFSDRRQRELAALLRDTPVGSKPYLGALQELLRLRRYLDLLHVQGLHLWRQDMVNNCEAFWIAEDGNAEIRIRYTLRRSAQELAFGKDDEETVEKLLDEAAQLDWDASSGAFAALKDALVEVLNDEDHAEYRRWVVNFLEDVVRPEITSQPSDNGRPLISTALGPVSFETRILDEKEMNLYLARLIDPWREFPEPIRQDVKSG